MVLIAFCAIALVANVTNAQPVRGGNNRRGAGKREGGKGVGRDKKEQKQDKRFGQLVMNPKKHITVQRMATPKHTEPPSLVSTLRKNTTIGEQLHYHMTTVIDKI